MFTPSISTSAAASSGGGGASLTDLQTEVLAGIEVPANAYDAGVPLVTQAVPSTIGSDVKLAVKIVNGVASDVSLSGHTLTPQGGAAISTSQSFVADGSYESDASGDRIDITQTTDHDPGSGDFMVEFAGYWDQSLPAVGSGMGKWPGGSNLSWHFGLRSSGGSTLLQFDHSTVGSDSNAVSADISSLIDANQWHHYRAVRKSNVLYMFVDGKLVYEAAHTDTIYTASTPTELIGTSSDDTQRWRGFQDCHRFQKGGTVDASEFAPARYMYGAARTIATPVLPEINITIPIITHDTDVATGDDKQVFVIPEVLEGKQLRSVQISHAAASSGASGTCDLQIYNVDQATDILTTKPAIDANEVNESTGTAAIVDEDNNTATARERWRFDIDNIPSSGTQAQGLSAELKFQ